MRCISIRRTGPHVNQVVFRGAAAHVPYDVQVFVQVREAVIDLIVPFVFDAVRRPDVGEVRAFGAGADRRVKMPALVERRIEVNQVNGLAVEAAQDGQVIAAEDRAGLDVHVHPFLDYDCFWAAGGTDRHTTKALFWSASSAGLSCVRTGGR